MNKIWTINNLSLKAEYLYNKICRCTLDLKVPDEFIKNLNNEYNFTLDILRNEGIGGVRINSIFRNLEE